MYIGAIPPPIPPIFAPRALSPPMRAGAVTTSSGVRARPGIRLSPAVAAAPNVPPATVPANRPPNPCSMSGSIAAAPTNQLPPMSWYSRWYFRYSMSMASRSSTLLEKPSRCSSLRPSFRCLNANGNSCKNFRSVASGVASGSTTCGIAGITDCKSSGCTGGAAIAAHVASTPSGSDR